MFGTSQYIELIEEAATNGPPITAQAASQEPRLLMGSGKWQSTLVTLTVKGIAGAACHYFNSDLWRYGGRANFLLQPSWHEVDSIHLKISYTRIEVNLQQARTRLSTNWSWSPDQQGLFRVRPEHIHIVEMVCGYLNLAAGHEVDNWAWGLFGLAVGSSRLAPAWLSKCLDQSFVEFSNAVGPMDPVDRQTAGRGNPHYLVEAITRVRGIPMEIVGVAEKPHKDKSSEAPVSNTALNEGTIVRLPGAWDTCEGNPCLCGDSVMVLDTTKQQLEVRKLAFGEQYLAISYVWTQHDERSLLSYVRRAIKAIGVHSVWVDRLCINQRCDQHKARQIPRMREVYKRGYATVALVPDISETLPTMIHFPTTDFSSGRTISAAKPFIAQMNNCAWRTRCWTWQEGLLGGRGYYVTQEQVLPARVVSDFLATSSTDGERRDATGLGIMDSLGVISLRCRIQTWSQKLFIGDLLDAEDHELIKYWLMPQVKSLGEALEVTKQRTASRPEDQIYSVLGMVTRGGDLQVVYGESRNTILRRAVNMGLLGTEILATRSISNRIGESWAAMDNTSQHIGQIYHLGRGIRASAQIDDRGLESQFHKLEGVAEIYVDGMCFVLRLANSKKEEIVCLVKGSEEEELRALASRVDQFLLLEKEGPGQFEEALLVNGTSRNVARVANGVVNIKPWMEVKTQVVSRVVG